MTRLSRRNTPLLARDHRGEAWLTVLIASLCFLARLAVLGTIATGRAASDWTRALGAEATVQVRARVDETGSQAAARAAETLAGVTGVREARALDRQAAEALLRPWIGEAVLTDLPLPHLVAVRLDPDAPASAVSLNRALAEAGIDAVVDDHSLWRTEARQAAANVLILTLSLLALTTMAAATAIGWITRTDVSTHTALMHTLRLNGADDGQITGVFATRYSLLAGRAGLIAALAAASLAAALRLLFGPEGVTPALPIDWSDILWLSPCPLLAATVALVMARLTALAHLRGRR